MVDQQSEPTRTRHHDHSFVPHWNRQLDVMIHGLILERCFMYVISVLNFSWTRLGMPPQQVAGQIGSQIWT